ncbi:glycoside hydrolase family 3 N-terminal domain-containing protein [Arthrobacter sp.]|uniref:glycoside hydrolase family 3 protein n=1 Tax=Arthrobacter sp. TaxID=1667 RepID=UPI003A8D61A9
MTRKSPPTARSRRTAAALAVPFVLILAVPAGMAMPAAADPSPGASAARHDEGNHGKPPRIDARSKDTLKIKGRTFKDLNGNGQLDPYEDWRLPAEQRAEDLVSQMTLEEKAGLMLIDTLNASCDQETRQRGTLDPSAGGYIQDQQMRRFIFRNTITSADEAVCGEADGGFQAKTSLTPDEAAGYMNSVQELAEATRLGIPVLYKSNARNHIDPNARAGINESAGAFTAFPKEAGIAAAALGQQALRTGEDPTTGDMSVVEDFAQVMGEEWKSVGLRGMYGYMADLSTEPRWYRVHETFTEDAALDANIMSSLVGTLQGPVDDAGVSLSPDSAVALTMKHFPGGGPQEMGLDAHYSFGKTQVYPGGAFGEHLKPFEAAIDAGVSAIMPYYGAPVQLTYDGVAYDQTGMAFSGQIVNDLLRGKLGFAGYVNSDTGIVTDRAWGLEDKSVPERVAAAVNGGTDTLSGFHDVKTITDLVANGLISEERVTTAAVRLTTPMFRLGLFENPYVDPETASRTVGSKAHRETGLDLQRKSAVLLENKKTGDGSKVLPLKPGASVYLLGDADEKTVAGYGYDVVNGNTKDPADRPSAQDSDYAVINVTVNNKNTSTYTSDGPTSGMNPEHTNPVTLDGVKGLDGKSPFGAADACVAQGADECTDDGLPYGGALPWEAGTLDFTGMAASESWDVSPSLDTIQQVMREVDDPRKVVLHVYFRQPFVMDQASGLRDAGAVIAGFGMSDTALFDVLSGKVSPQGRMPFALAGTSRAIDEQYSDLPGYRETTDGALYPFGYGLTY